MSHSFESSLSFLSPLSSKVRFDIYLIFNRISNFKIESTDTNDVEKDVNQTAGVILPLSLLFDATVDDDYLAVQSLLSKNYDVNAKV
jgi:hypothetical protein